MEDEKIFLQKKRKCPDGENKEEIKEKEKLDEKILNKEEKPTQYNTEINENELNISKSSLKTEKSNEKSRKRKKKSEMKRDE